MLEGLPPNNAARLLKLTCSETEARAAADAVVETFDPAETAAAAFAVEASPRVPKPWAVEIYFAEGVAEDRLRACLAEAVGRELAGAARLERVDEQDWVAASLASLVPVRAGRFLVHGRHDRAAVRPNDVAIEIEAALAFGTGHHGTTRGCLVALDRILRRRRPRRVLDLGTGTGVLAMAAAKVLKRPVWSGDLDPAAVEAAFGNAARNGVAGFTRPVLAAGLSHPRLRAMAPYDLIFANILAEPLRKLAPAIAAHAAAGADLVLSGLLARDVAGVRSAYGAHGFAYRHRLDLEGWVTLMMRTRRGATRPRKPCRIAHTA